jgi:hypothetical protein
MLNKFSHAPGGEIRGFYQEAFRTLDPGGRNPEIEVSFYPYIGINHTIRVRNEKVFVRIADICREMPADGQRALAYILVAKLLRKQVPESARKIYSSFIKTGEIQSKASENKRTRGKKIITTAQGEVYDLSTIFDSLNDSYFQGLLPKPVLTWSARRTYRILGHHDSTHDTIAVSRSLDDRSVPRYVVEYVVFHEMLHIFHPTRHVNGRRYNHTTAFRRDEKKFRKFAEADQWIEQNVRHLKRRAKRSNS